MQYEQHFNTQGKKQHPENEAFLHLRQEYRKVGASSHNTEAHHYKIKGGHPIFSDKIYGHRSQAGEQNDGHGNHQIKTRQIKFLKFIVD